MSVRLFVHSQGITRITLEGFSWHLIFDYFSNSWENLTRKMCTLHEDLCTFRIISRWIFLKIIKSQTKFVERIKIHILYSITFSRKSYHLSDNVEKYCKDTQTDRQTDRQTTDDNIILRIHLACWIIKATETHSEYVILIAFPQQQWLHECLSIQRCTYIVLLLLSSGDECRNNGLQDITSRRFVHACVRLDGVTLRPPFQCVTYFCERI
jgi:hypothetical protein